MLRKITELWHGLLRVTGVESEEEEQLLGVGEDRLNERPNNGIDEN